MDSNDEFIDDILSKQLNLMKLPNYNSRCVIHGIGNYPDNSEWGIDQITDSDKRIKLMLTNLDIDHGLPIQRFCWPKMSKPNYPVICISPPATGKTYTHLLFIVSRIILDIPKSKTDQLMVANESVLDKYVIGQDCNLLKPKGSCESSNSSTLNNSRININEIDQENEDFDALLDAEFGDGKDKAVGPINGNNNPPHISSTSLDPWGLNDFDPEDLIRQPKYIIVCSNTDSISQLYLSINQMKKAAFGHRVTERGLHNMPPKVKKINKNLADEQLAIICNQCDIIICTPETILTCIDKELITFRRCKQLIFDDLDLSLQLHNQSLREIAKHYILQSDQIETTPQPSSSIDSYESIHNICYNYKPTLPSSENKKCQIFMFSRKWNYLIKQFTETLFLQRILIFSSIAEAALYQKIRFDLECCFENFQQTRLTKTNKLAKYYTDNYIINNKTKFNTQNNDYSHNNINHNNNNMMIICNDFTEANQLYLDLTNSHNNLSNNIHLLDETTMLPSQIHSMMNNHKKLSKLPIYIICDRSLEFLVDYFNDIDHLVHYSMPDNMLIFDQRFRSMFKMIKDKDNRQPLLSTIFISNNFGLNNAKDLYDLISRSPTTLRSCKMELRDYINEKSTTICWRWATTGACILGNLSKGDKLGTYCPDKHPAAQKGFEENEKQQKEEGKVWPIEGDQCHIVISNFISPNEFYFWFEQYRNIDEQVWQNVDKSGRSFMKKFEKELYKFRDVRPNSIGLDKFRKDKVYGIYLPAEIRVARVKLLENPVDVFKNLADINKSKKRGLLTNLNLLYEQEYSKQYYVLQIDYGIKIKAYLRNLFELPKQLLNIQPQCHRAFLLGLTPAQNEPNWTTKAKQFFEEMIFDKYAGQITVWLRQHRFNCYWFESMLIGQKLDNLSKFENSNIISGYSGGAQESPISKIIQNHLAERPKSLPHWLPPSRRHKTISRWHLDQCKNHIQFAFLDKEKIDLNLYLLQITPSLGLRVRQIAYNKKLIDLEDKMLCDYNDSKLIQLKYIAIGSYCLARIAEGENPESKKIIYTINRCKILEHIKLEKNQDCNLDSIDSSSEKYLVECLDHGDVYDVYERDLFLAPIEYISILPFQAILCKLADLNSDMLAENKNLCDQIRELLYDCSRNKNNQLVEMKAFFNRNRDLYLYMKITNNFQENKNIESSDYTHKSLVQYLEDETKRKDLFLLEDDSFRRDIKYIEREEMEEEGDEVEKETIDDKKSFEGRDVEQDKINYSTVKLLILSIVKDMIEKELALAKKNALNQNGISQEEAVC